MPGEDKGGDPLQALGGTSLRVYLYLLTRRGPVGVREVQRALGFRSPSTARHHLERLVSLGLASRDDRGYRARRPTGILSGYILVAGRLVPKMLFTTGLLIGATIAYPLLPDPDPRAVALLAAATATSLWHTMALYRGISRLLGREEQRE